MVYAFGMNATVRFLPDLRIGRLLPPGLLLRRQAPY